MFSRIAVKSSSLLRLQANANGDALLTNIVKRNISLSVIKRSSTEQDSSEQPKTKKESYFDALSKKGPIRWINMTIGTGMCAAVAGYMYYLNVQKQKKRDADRKRQLGKALIGGPWELVNHDGKLMSSKDYLGKWTLIYFGFTHCPDVCPDEIEKMVTVLNKLEEQKRRADVDIVGLFFTVDPGRDTPEKIKTYITEFSPKLMGFTGTKEQIEKVCKTFRVYFSQGPKDQFSDYIVDHTIIIYLVDPDGNFVDYYGQRTSIEDMINTIQLLDSKYKFQKKEESGELSIIDRIKMSRLPS